MSSVAACSLLLTPFNMLLNSIFLEMYGGLASTQGRLKKAPFSSGLESRLKVALRYTPTPFFICGSFRSSTTLLQFTLQFTFAVLFCSSLLQFSSAVQLCFCNSLLQFAFAVDFCSCSITINADHVASL